MARAGAARRVIQAASWPSPSAAGSAVVESEVKAGFSPHSVVGPRMRASHECESAAPPAPMIHIRAPGAANYAVTLVEKAEIGVNLRGEVWAAL